MSFESALIEGREAHTLGKFLDDNPYDPVGAYIRHNFWEAGWLEQYNQALWKLDKTRRRRPGWSKPQWKTTP